MRKNILTFLGGKGWGGGVLGCLDFGIVVWMFFLVVASLNVFLKGEVKWCNVLFFWFMFFALGEFLWVFATFLNCFFWRWNPHHKVEGEAARSAKCPCLIIFLAASLGVYCFKEISIPWSTKLLVYLVALKFRMLPPIPQKKYPSMYRFPEKTKVELFEAQLYHFEPIPSELLLFSFWNEGPMQTTKSKGFTRPHWTN